MKKLLSYCYNGFWCREHIAPIILMGILCILMHGCSNGEGKLLNQANDLIIEKDFVQAGQLLKKALKMNPGSALAHNNLGYIYMETNKLDDAEKEFNQALQNYTKPEDKAIVHNNIGMLKEKQGDNKQAEKQYLTAIEMNPKYTVTYINYALLLNSLGQSGKAIELMKKGLEQNPGNTQLLHETGDLAAKNNDLALAIDSYEQLCQKVPFFAGYRAYLGVMYLQSHGAGGDDTLLDKARRSLDSAISLDAKNALALAGLGEYYLITGDLEEAEKSVRNSLELNPDIVYGHIVLGKIYIAGKKHDQARKIFEKGMALDPKNEIIPGLLEQMK